MAVAAAVQLRVPSAPPLPTARHLGVPRATGLGVSRELGVSRLQRFSRHKTLSKRLEEKQLSYHGSHQRGHDGLTESDAQHKLLWHETQRNSSALTRAMNDPFTSERQFVDILESSSDPRAELETAMTIRETWVIFQGGNVITHESEQRGTPIQLAFLNSGKRALLGAMINMGDDLSALLREKWLSAHQGFGDGFQSQIPVSRFGDSRLQSWYAALFTKPWTYDDTRAYDRLAFPNNYVHTHFPRDDGDIVVPTCYDATIPPDLGQAIEATHENLQSNYRVRFERTNCTPDSLEALGLGPTPVLRMSSTGEGEVFESVWGRYISNIDRNLTILMNNPTPYPWSVKPNIDMSLAYYSRPFLPVTYTHELCHFLGTRDVPDKNWTCLETRMSYRREPYIGNQPTYIPTLDRAMRTITRRLQALNPRPNQFSGLGVEVIHPITAGYNSWQVMAAHLLPEGSSLTTQQQLAELLYRYYDLSHISLSQLTGLSNWDNEYLKQVVGERPAPGTTDIFLGDRIPFVHPDTTEIRLFDINNGTLWLDLSKPNRLSGVPGTPFNPFQPPYGCPRFELRSPASQIYVIPPSEGAVQITTGASNHAPFVVAVDPENPVNVSTDSQDVWVLRSASLECNVEETEVMCGQTRVISDGRVHIDDFESGKPTDIQMIAGRAERVSPNPERPPAEQPRINGQSVENSVDQADDNEWLLPIVSITGAVCAVILLLAYLYKHYQESRRAGESDRVVDSSSQQTSAATGDVVIEMSEGTGRVSPQVGPAPLGSNND